MSFYSRAFLLEKLFFSASLYFIALNKNQLISDSQPHLHSKYHQKETISSALVEQLMNQNNQRFLFLPFLLNFGK